MLLSLAGAGALRLPSRLVISRRAVSLSALLALPSASHAKFGDGCTECQETELETSPLIEELKRRTAENAEKNAAIVRATTREMGNVNDPGMKMVRYQGINDSIPVTRMMTPPMIKELEKAAGVKVSCPSWGGACEVLVAPKK